MAAISFFILGLVLQLYVAHGMHNHLQVPTYSMPVNNSTDKEPENKENKYISLASNVIPGPVKTAFGRSGVSEGNKKIAAPGHDARSFRYRDILTLPPIVKAWRQAKVDWHSIIPTHLSNWERFGDKQGLSLLVNKEIQLTNYLTRLKESGLLTKYGHDFGPLAAYDGW